MAKRNSAILKAKCWRRGRAGLMQGPGPGPLRKQGARVQGEGQWSHQVRGWAIQSCGALNTTRNLIRPCAEISLIRKFFCIFVSAKFKMWLSFVSSQFLVNWKATRKLFEVIGLQRTVATFYGSSSKVTSFLYDAQCDCEVWRTVTQNDCIKCFKRCYSLRWITLYARFRASLSLFFLSGYLVSLPCV